jgi:hypothetical protein
MEAQPGSGPPIQDLLFDVRIGPLVGAFLLLAALDHGLVALPRISDRYERSLAAGVNPFRWVEYSLSASLMRRTPRRRRWLLRCCRRVVAVTGAGRSRDARASDRNRA